MKNLTKERKRIISNQLKIAGIMDGLFIVYLAIVNSDIISMDPRYQLFLPILVAIVILIWKGFMDKK